MARLAFIPILMNSTVTETGEMGLHLFWGQRHVCQQMSTNPYSKLLNSTFTCVALKITLFDLNYAAPSFWISKEILPSCHNWSVQTVAVWNTAAHLRLIDHNPTWIRDLVRDIPEENWEHKNICNGQFSKAATKE